MHMFWIWLVLCMGSSLCVNEVEYEGNYADSYDNEISLDQQEGDSPNTPCHSDLSRWDKLFIALEDSHMRQNMLLESVEQHCGGLVSVKTELEKLTNGMCLQCGPSLESACRVQAEQASLRLQKGLVDLRDEEEERERRLNATLQMLLHSRHEEHTWLKRIEEALSSGPKGSRIRQQPTPQPNGFGTAFGLEMKPFTSVLKEQEVTSPLDVSVVETALVAIATDLQRLQRQLSKVIEQVGTLGKGREDT